MAGARLEVRCAHLHSCFVNQRTIADSELRNTGRSQRWLRVIMCGQAGRCRVRV